MNYEHARSIDSTYNADHTCMKAQLDDPQFEFEASQCNLLGSCPDSS
jgi:hypothetical protein